MEEGGGKRREREKERERGRGGGREGRREKKGHKAGQHGYCMLSLTSAGLIVLLSPISCAVGASLTVELLLTMW